MRTDLIWLKLYLSSFPIPVNTVKLAKPMSFVSV